MHGKGSATGRGDFAIDVDEIEPFERFAHVARCLQVEPEHQSQLIFGAGEQSKHADEVPPPLVDKTLSLTCCEPQLTRFLETAREICVGAVLADLFS